MSGAIFGNRDSKIRARTWWISSRLKAFPDANFFAQKQICHE